MNRNVGQASRLPPSAMPTERNRSRWRARWAGGTPALRWARLSSWSQCMRKSESMPSVYHGFGLRPAIAREMNSLISALQAFLNGCIWILLMSYARSGQRTFSESLHRRHGRVEYSRQNPVRAFRLHPDAIRSGFRERVRK